MVTDNKKVKNVLTTHEQRELIYAHNSIFMTTFVRAGLSVAFPIMERSGIDWVKNYQLKREATKIDGI